MRTKPSTPPITIERSLQAVLVAVSGAFVVLYLVVAIRRMGYPFALEWMEGGSLESIHRILRGQTLYVQPSLDFIPYIYMPLYWYLSAGVAKLVGVGFYPLRLVSFAASLSTLGFIYLIARKEFGSRFAGIIAAGFFAAMFRLSGAWLDIARVDSLFLALLLIAIYLIRYGTTRASTILAALYLILAYLTKQSALFALVPLALYALVSNRRRGVVLIAVTGAGILIANLILNSITGGWYQYYMFYLLSRHGIWSTGAVLFVADLVAVWIACIVVGVYLRNQLARSFRQSLFALALVVGLAGTSFISRINVASDQNVLLPACAALAILFGVAVNALWLWFNTRAVGAWRSLAALALYAVCLYQFGILLYDPAQQIPTKQDYQAGITLLDQLTKIKGDVFAPSNSYLLLMVDKPTFAHSIAIWEVYGGGGTEAQQLQETLREKIRSRQFSAIVTDSAFSFSLSLPDLDTYYVQAGMLFDDPNVFYPVTGGKVRPQYIYVPRQSP